ncbi:VOC family protein [Aquicoccus sp. SCR17]|nr:VOC family protein [Carideicomes alvinocaridis]
MPHFEIHVADMARAKAFYGGLFGWSFAPMAGGEAVEYHLASGAQLGDGGLTLALMRRMDETPAQGSPVRGGTLRLGVADCDASYAWALDHGGAEALPPMDYPGIGRCAYVEDGEGNILGLESPAGTEG